VYESDEALRRLIEFAENHPTLGSDWYLVSRVELELARSAIAEDES
jgi:hypothetical protein